MFSVSVMREKRKMNDELEIYFEKETLNKSNSAVHFHLELALTKNVQFLLQLPLRRKHTITSLNWLSRRKNPQKSMNDSLFYYIVALHFFSRCGFTQIVGLLIY